MSFLTNEIQILLKNKYLYDASKLQNSENLFDIYLNLLKICDSNYILEDKMNNKESKKAIIKHILK